jgi:hypothetical protein
MQDEDLYGLLQTVIAPAPVRSRSDRRLVIGDSKALYQSGKGLKQLERGLWSAWSLMEPEKALAPEQPDEAFEQVVPDVVSRPTTCGDVWTLLTGLDATARHEALASSWDSLPAPRDFDPAELESLRPDLGREFERTGVRLVGLKSRAVFPREFNETVDRCGSKGAALSRWTLGLVARLIELLADEPIFILCDKHGGRNHYLPPLTDCFPGRYIEIVSEGRLRSRYRFGPPERRVEIAFQAKGESHLPTALASMASKYLRELAMHAFNDFWRQHLPGLAPTAGYPVDARRFKDEIAAVQRSLGIEDRMLWRMK